MCSSSNSSGVIANDMQHGVLYRGSIPRASCLIWPIESQRRQHLNIELPLSQIPTSSIELIQ